MATSAMRAGRTRCWREHGVDTVIHFAAHTIVPESVADPLKYYGNNTCQTRSLLASCLRHGVKNFVFSSTAAVYGIPESGVAAEDSALAPINPYGTSKLMSEWMLRDVALASPLRYVVLRYFNVAGSDPAGRIGQSTRKATLLVKVACEASVGKRTQVSIFGTDYPTPDGTGVRDYIHVQDLASAHLLAVDYLAAGGESRDPELRLRPWLQRPRGAAQRRARQRKTAEHRRAAASRRATRPHWWRSAIASARCSGGSPGWTTWTASSAARSTGNRSCSASPGHSCAAATPHPCRRASARIRQMNLLRPRSLSALALLGLAIIALPLVAALVTAGVQVRQPVRDQRADHRRWRRGHAPDARPVRADLAAGTRSSACIACWVTPG